jgi:hypothetical protein
LKDFGTEAIGLIIVEISARNLNSCDDGSYYDTSALQNMIELGQTYAAVTIC